MMKRWMVLVLALLLAAPCVARAEMPDAAPVAGVRVLLVEGGADKATGQLTNVGGAALVLAALPAAGYTDILYYYKGTPSSCALPQGATLPERAAVLAPWAAALPRDNVSRKTNQSKGLGQISALLTARGAAAAGSEALWLPKADLSPDDTGSCTDVLAKLISRGLTLRVALTPDMPVLAGVLAQCPGVAVETLTNDPQALLDAELPRLGYQALGGDTLAHALAGARLTPQAVLPGEMVAVELNAPAAATAALSMLDNMAAALLAPGDSLPLQGGLIAWAEAAALPADGAQADQEAQTAADTPAPGTEAMTGTAPDVTAQGEAPAGPTPPPQTETAGGETQASLADIQPPVTDATPTLEPTPTPEPTPTSAPDTLVPVVRLYLKPDASLGIAGACDPAGIPYREAEPGATVVLASDAAYAAMLLDGDLTAPGAPFTLNAALLPAQGEALPVQIVSMQGGAVKVRLPKAEPGAYTLRLTLDASPLGLAAQYTVDAPLAFEEPLTVNTQAQADGGLRLTVQPMLWHQDPSEATLDPNALFTGDYRPVKAYSSAPAVVALREEANGVYTAQALMAGSATLMLVSRGGETLVSVPVEVINGTGRVLWEAGLALALVLVALGVWLLLRHTQPRFRKCEQVRLTACLAGAVGAERTLPLKPYRARGVTLWRLLILSGQARDWRASRQALLKVALVPRRDGLALRVRDASAQVNGAPGPGNTEVVPGARIRIGLGQGEIFVELIAPGQGNEKETGKQ